MKKSFFMSVGGAMPVYLGALFTARGGIGFRYVF